MKRYLLNEKDYIKELKSKDKQLLINTIALAVEVLTLEEYNNILTICREAIEGEVKR